jgi:hypothetical protein
MSAMYIDGDVFITEAGILERFTRGKSDGWEAGSPDDTLLRPTADLVLVAGSGDQRDGVVYAFDRRNDRVLAFDKAGGEYLAQYRLAGGRPEWEDLRGLYVIPGVEEAPPTLVWLGEDRIGQAVLEAVADEAPRATPTATPDESDESGEEPADTTPKP